MNAPTDVLKVADSAGKAAKSPLALMLCISFLVHFLLAISVSIEQLELSPRFPDDARISLITPTYSAPELIEWIRSNDPANVFKPGPALDDLMQLPYTYSFDFSVPLLQKAEPSKIDLDVPSIRKPGEQIGFRRGGLSSGPRLNPAVVIDKACHSTAGIPLRTTHNGLTPDDLAHVSGAAFFIRADVRGLPAPIVLSVKKSGSDKLDTLGGNLLQSLPAETPGGSGLFRLSIEPFVVATPSSP